MGFPKDIINIVISMKMKYEKKRLNQNYYDKYDIIDTTYYRYGISLRYNRGWFNINYRDVRGYYREEIVCFLTNTTTRNKLPKNY